jgi:hypothetical protein
VVVGKAAGKSDGVFSSVRSVVCSTRLKGTGAYQKGVVRDAFTAILPHRSMHTGAAVALCKGSVQAFLKAVETSPDTLTDALYDGLVAVNGPSFGAVPAPDVDDSALFFVDASGDRPDGAPATDDEEDRDGGQGAAEGEDEVQDNTVDEISDEIAARVRGAVDSTATADTDSEAEAAVETPRRTTRKRAAAINKTPKGGTTETPTRSKRLRTPSAKVKR